MTDSFKKLEEEYNKKVQELKYKLEKEKFYTDRDKMFKRNYALVLDNCMSKIKNLEIFKNSSITFKPAAYHFPLYDGYIEYNEYVINLYSDHDISLKLKTEYDHIDFDPYSGSVEHVRGPKYGIKITYEKIGKSTFIILSSNLTYFVEEYMSKFQEKLEEGISNFLLKNCNLMAIVEQNYNFDDLKNKIKVLK